MSSNQCEYCNEIYERRRKKPIRNNQFALDTCYIDAGNYLTVCHTDRFSGVNEYHQIPLHIDYCPWCGRKL